VEWVDLAQDGDLTESEREREMQKIHGDYRGEYIWTSERRIAEFWRNVFETEVTWYYLGN